MVNDLSSILKKYLAALEKNEAGVAELTRNLRGWVVENGDVVKEKIVNQIEEGATRMGFVKIADLDKLLERISDLERQFPLENASKVKVKASKVKVKASKVKVKAKKTSSKAAKKSVASKKSGV